MKNKKINYIDKYNKENYKMYQFRIKKSDEKLIKIIDEKANKNDYIVSLIKNDSEVISLKNIKEKIKPIIDSYNINEVYLFGSYSRGEATYKSDIDFYMNKGNTKTIFDEIKLSDDLKNALNKDIDIVFIEANTSDDLKEEIMRDRIRLW